MILDLPAPLRACACCNLSCSNSPSPHAPGTRHAPAPLHTLMCFFRFTCGRKRILELTGNMARPMLPPEMIARLAEAERVRSVRRAGWAQGVREGGGC